MGVQSGVGLIIPLGVLPIGIVAVPEGIVAVPVGEVTVEAMLAGVC